MSTVTEIREHRWKRHLDRHADKRVRATAANLSLILSNDPEIVGRIAFNEFTGEVVQRGSLPWGEFSEAGDAWQDHHAFELAAYLSASGGPSYRMNVGTRQVHEAVEAAARAFAFHPVRDWLAGLSWDGKPRLAKLFGSMIGGEDTAYTATVSKNFLVGAIDRVLNPGGKVDNMVVIEGPQGAGKSRVCAAMFAPWHAEAMESPASKDFYQALRGVWALEIAEMDSFRGAEVTKVKQAITATSDRYRPSYGRTARDFPRQCIFIGTTNESEYLRDATGARRFLPVKCGARIDVDAIAAQREQLFAEARHLLNTRYEWWQSPPGAEVEQEERYLHDAWEPVLSRWLDHPPPPPPPRDAKGGSDQPHRDAKGGSDQPHREPAIDVQRDGTGRVVTVAIAEALRFALYLDYSRQTRAEQMRAAALLRRLGWKKRRAGAADGGRTYLWERPE